MCASQGGRREGNLCRAPLGPAAVLGLCVPPPPHRSVPRRIPCPAPVHHRAPGHSPLPLSLSASMGLGEVAEGGSASLASPIHAVTSAAPSSRVILFHPSVESERPLGCEGMGAARVGRGAAGSSSAVAQRETVWRAACAVGCTPRPSMVAVELSASKAERLKEQEQVARVASCASTSMSARMELLVRIPSDSMVSYVCSTDALRRPRCLEGSHCVLLLLAINTSSSLCSPPRPGSRGRHINYACRDPRPLPVGSDPAFLGFSSRETTSNILRVLRLCATVLAPLLAPV